MTRNEFKRRCRAQKTKSYKLILAGWVIAIAGFVAVAAGVLLANSSIVDLRTEIVICAAGFVAALIGIGFDLAGEAVTSKTYKAYRNGNHDIVFQKVKRQNSFTLENQNGKIEKFSDADICNYLDDMFIAPDQFVTLTAPIPRQEVRFVQACRSADQIELQLGVEKNGTRLVYKLCSKEECRRIFLDFYSGRFVPIDCEYRPVQF